MSSQANKRGHLKATSCSMGTKQKATSFIFYEHITKIFDYTYQENESSYLLKKSLVCYN